MKPVITLFLAVVQPPYFLTPWHSLEGDTANSFTHLAIPIYYSFPVPLRVGGWVGLVGWPMADALPTKGSHVNHGSCVDQGKSASYRPTS